MQWLLTAHARRYHRHYGTRGHIWQGRFKAFPVQDDDHLVAVLRYVERNPVRDPEGTFPNYGRVMRGIGKRRAFDVSWRRILDPAGDMPGYRRDWRRVGKRPALDVYWMLTFESGVACLSRAIIRLGAILHLDRFLHLNAPGRVSPPSQRRPSG
jgi:hypothetical protein